MINQFFYPFFGFILGIILGSFIKALADRSLSKKSFLGRSSCPKCHTTLKWYDLLPVFSYLTLRGRCRYCHTKIKLEYLLVEVGMGILVAFLFWQSFSQPFLLNNIYALIVFFFTLAFKMFIVAVLFVVTLTDLHKTLIPDRIILPGILIALVSLIMITTYKIWYLYYVLAHHPIGKFLLPPKSDYFFRHALMTAEPLIGGIIMAILFGLFFLTIIVITRGRGMGGGDFKLGIFMGFTLGFPNSLLALILSFISGSLVGMVLLILGRRKLRQTIPFGPFLSLGSLIAVFWADKILNWYLSLKI